ncbi:MAG: hypothetical protein R6V05_00070 [Candidatus Brocadiia bacterium]
MQSPGLWKLAPETVVKPWGLVHGEARRFSGIEVGLGEIWLASAQTGPGNYSNTVVHPVLRKTLAELLREADQEDEPALQDLLGERALRHLRDKPHRGKTEAWHVRAARGRTGVAAGPRTHEQAERLREIITGPGLDPAVESWSQEVRELFGIIEPLQGGEVFLVPAGTLHTMFAIGPDSALIIDEIQQGYGEARLPTLSKILMVQNDLLSVQVHPGDTIVAEVESGEIEVDQDLQANPTVRLYDFGRRPGEYPELGFRLVNPEAGLRRAAPISVQVAEGHQLEALVAEVHLLKSRHSLAGGGTYRLRPVHGSYRVVHWLEGTGRLLADGDELPMKRGDTAFVPGCMEEGLQVAAESDCALFEDTLPDLAGLSAFLGKIGVAAAELEALLSPPRVLARD